MAQLTNTQVYGSLTVTGISVLQEVVVNTRISLVGSSTTQASLNIPHGTAPSTPINGDIWTTTSGVFARINGTTIGPFGTSDSHSHANKATLDGINQSLATTSSVSFAKVTTTGTGNDYHTTGFETRGNGATNTIFPGIGFHQPGLFAGSLQQRNGTTFGFYQQGGTALADLQVRTLIATTCEATYAP